MNSEFKYVEIGEVNEPSPNQYVDIDTSSVTSEKINKLISDINDSKNVFLFIFMQSCGPCKETKPEWKNLKTLNHNGTVVALLNEKLLSNKEYKKLNSLIGSQPLGFPTFKYIKGVGKNSVEDYNGDRNEDAFKKWIHKKTESSSSSSSSSSKREKKPSHMIGGKRKTRKNKRKQTAGKWSMKYKKSINCKKPKGFSQKQHCKYGRKNWSKK